jgi:hypothetical protein
MGFPVFLLRSMPSTCQDINIPSMGWLITSRELEPSFFHILNYYTPTMLAFLPRFNIDTQETSLLLVEGPFQSPLSHPLSPADHRIKTSKNHRAMKTTRMDWALLPPR